MDRGQQSLSVVAQNARLREGSLIPDRLHDRVLLPKPIDQVLDDVGDLDQRHAATERQERRLLSGAGIFGSKQ